jgi:hypothetical protein
MWEDPIVAEVHRARQELAAAFDFDVKAIFADLRKRQAALGSKLVHPKKQSIESLQPTGPAVAVSDSSPSPQAGPAVER